MPAQASAQHAQARNLVRTAELVAELSLEIDDAAGMPGGHSVRTCFMAIRAAEALGMTDRQRSPLFYAALLHEVADDATHEVGFGPDLTVAVTALNERWDGRGIPIGLSGEGIPLIARLVTVCHDLDRLAALHGARFALETILARSGSWYDPQLVDLLLALASQGLLRDAADAHIRLRVRELEPAWLVLRSDRTEAARIRSLLRESAA